MNPVHTDKPREVTATELQRDYARVIRDAEYHRATLITRRGKTVAKVVHPDDDAAAVIARMRKFADELRDGYGNDVAAQYSRRLDGILDEIEGRP